MRFASGLRIPPMAARSSSNPRCRRSSPASSRAFLPLPMTDPTVAAPRRFRFVVFDWDGTLADSTAIIANALQQACRDVGEPVPSNIDARFVIGLGLTDALRHVAPNLPAARQPDLVARYRY